jgi:hypothetical protein
LQNLHREISQPLRQRLTEKAEKQKLKIKLAKAFAKRFSKKDAEEETQSVVTSNTEEVSGRVPGKETITRDFGWTVNERQYKDKTPTMTKLGV